MQLFSWILAILLSAAAGYWVYRADVKRAIPYPWLTALLRGLVILLTLVLILIPSISINRTETQKPVIVFLQDESISIAQSLGKDSVAYRDNAEDLTEKLDDKYRVVRWGFGNRVQTDSLFGYKQQATDISAAVARVQEFYGAQNLGAIILATDGRFNQGNNPLYQQVSLNSPLYTVGIGDSTVQKDIRVARVYANKTVSLNSSFEINADIVATLGSGYNTNAVVQEGGNTLATAPLNIDGNRYDRSVAFRLKADKTGMHHYTITIPPAPGETNTANNRRDVFVEVVDEKKKILIAAASPHPDINAIREALTGMESYEVVVRTMDNMPGSFDAYDIIILHQLPPVFGTLNQIRNLRKPIWYFVGAQTNAATLNEMRPPATFTVNPSVQRNVFAGYNTNFNAFILPQNIQAVIDKMPPLSVAAGEIRTSPSANVLFEQKNDPAHTPLWVLQQGNIPSAMITGEGLWRWRLYEYKNFNTHQVVDECIRQTISFLSVNNNEKPFRVELPKYVWNDRESINLNAYLLNANNEQVNTAEANLVITDSAGRRQNFAFERSGSAYRINIGGRAGGTYNYTASAVYNGKTYTTGGSFVVESMPLELMESGADFVLLYNMAHKYNGHFVPAAAMGSLYDSITTNNNITPIIQSTTETVPLVDWKWFFFVILILAVAEWLLRKYWMAQ